MGRADSFVLAFDLSWCDQVPDLSPRLWAYAPCHFLAGFVARLGTKQNPYHLLHRQLKVLHDCVSQ